MLFLNRIRLCEGFRFVSQFRLYALSNEAWFEAFTFASSACVNRGRSQ